MTSYQLAQRAVADLKASIYEVLVEHPDGLKNVDLGKSLGIYAGHVGHEGHIPRTMLAIMESEGVVFQEAESKRWFVRKDKSQ